MNMIGTVKNLCHIFFVKNGKQHTAPAKDQININCPELIEKSTIKPHSSF